MKLYEVVTCRQCTSFIKDCKCVPIPCPFCDEEYGFSQDWNIHLMNMHKKELARYD